MIISYMAIHHDIEHESLGRFENARAEQMRITAERHGVPIRDKPDGATTYIEASLSLPSLGKSAGAYPHLDEADEDSWDSYVEFLLDLEDSNLGYLLHEVETHAERRLLETLVDTGDDSASLKYVSIDYRVEARP